MSTLSVGRVLRAVAALIGGVWAALWASILVAGNLTPTVAQALVAVAALTALTTMMLYLVLPAHGQSRTSLVLTPALLLMPMLLCALLLRHLPGAAGEVLEQAGMALGFLVFPAGALTAGLVAGVLTDLARGSIRELRARLK